MSAESSAHSVAVQSAAAAGISIAMLQQQNQPFQMGVDSWFTEYAQALQLAKDLENLMKKNKNLVKNVNSNYERNLNLVLISQRVTKLWQILDRLDALGKNPDRTRVTELEQGHRQKLLEEERCRVMQMFRDFQDYHALTGQSSRSEQIQNSQHEERFRANYYTGLAELLSPDERVKGVTSGAMPLNHSGPSTLQ